MELNGLEVSILVLGKDIRAGLLVGKKGHDSRTVARLWIWIKAPEITHQAEHSARWSFGGIMT